MSEIFYSPSENAIYASYSHKSNLPDDVVSISKARYDEVMTQMTDFSLLDDKKVAYLEPDEEGNPLVKYKEQEEYQFSEDEIRTMRNNVLRRTDWTQLPDVPKHIKEMYVDYRQQLRDVTKQPNFPQDVEWPKSPEKN